MALALTACLLAAALAPEPARLVRQGIAEAHVGQSFIAVWRPRETRRKISSLPSSVRLTSADPSSNSLERPPFDSIGALIFSSTVPRQTNLWTRTFCAAAFSDRTKNGIRSSSWKS
jgi:hypothetical protein